MKTMMLKKGQILTLYQGVDRSKIVTVVAVVNIKHLSTLISFILK